MKHIIPFTKKDVENIIINRFKEIHPDVTGLSVAWTRKGMVVYMDKAPTKIRMRTIRNESNIK